MPPEAVDEKPERWNCVTEVRRRLIHVLLMTTVTGEDVTIAPKSRNIAMCCVKS
jgi:hypothetical protein